MALNHLFLPDKINYAALGNVFERLHVHFIPRYKTKRVFSGVDFIDTRWGKNYAPYEHNFKISSVSVHEIKLSLQLITWKRYYPLHSQVLLWVFMKKNLEK